MRDRSHPTLAGPIRTHATDRLVTRNHRPGRTETVQSPDLPTPYTSFVPSKAAPHRVEARAGISDRAELGRLLLGGTD